MHFDRRRAIFAGSATLGAALLPAGVRAASQTALAFGPPSATYVTGMIALEKGFFKDEGLDLSLLTGNSGTHGRQAVAAGQALFAHGDASHPLQLSMRGKPCKIILATQMVASIANMVVRRDLYDAGIRTIEDLAAWKRPDGSKPIIAATAIGSGTWVYGTYLFEAKKLNDKVHWVAGGGPRTMYPGLETKQFDAITAIPSWIYEIEAKGFGRVIYDTKKPGAFAQEFGGTVPVLVIYALEETIKDERSKVQAFVNGMYKAMRWTKSTPIDDVYALVGKKYFDGIDAGAVKADIEFDAVTWDFDGRVDKASFERGGKVWYRPGTDIQPVKYEDIVDMSFVDAAQAKFK